MAELTTLARPYARAIFDLTSDDASRSKWSEQLARLAEVVSHEEMRTLVGNPRIEADELAELVCEAAGKEAAGDEGRNLVRLLVANRRLAVLPRIAELYEQLRAEAEHVIDVEVISATPLDKAQQDKIASALGKRLGREVRLHCREDEEVLGGVIIRAGDLVIDGSVRGQLERLSGALVH